MSRYRTPYRPISPGSGPCTSDSIDSSIRSIVEGDRIRPTRPGSRVVHGGSRWNGSTTPHSLSRSTVLTTVYTGHTVRICGYRLGVQGPIADDPAPRLANSLARRPYSGMYTKSWLQRRSTPPAVSRPGGCRTVDETARFDNPCFDWNRRSSTIAQTGTAVRGWNSSRCSGSTLQGRPGRYRLRTLSHAQTRHGFSQDWWRDAVHLVPRSRGKEVFR